MYGIYFNRLSDLKDELAARELPPDLDTLIAIAITIGMDNRLCEQKKEQVLDTSPGDSLHLTGNAEQVCSCILR